MASSLSPVDAAAAIAVEPKYEPINRAFVVQSPYCRAIAMHLKKRELRKHPCPWVNKLIFLLEPLSKNLLLTPSDALLAPEVNVLHPGHIIGCCVFTGDTYLREQDLSEETAKLSGLVLGSLEDAWDQNYRWAWHVGHARLFKKPRPIAALTQASMRMTWVVTEVEGATNKKGKPKWSVFAPTH